MTISDGLKLESFLAGLFLPEGTSIFAAKRAADHFDFFFLPVNLGVVVLEPVIAQDQLLLL